MAKKTQEDFYWQYLAAIEEKVMAGQISAGDDELVKLLALTEGYRRGEDMNLIKLSWVEGEGDKTMLADRLAATLAILDAV